MNIPNPPMQFGTMTEREAVKSDLLRLGVYPRFFQIFNDATLDELKDIRDGLRRVLGRDYV